MSLGFNMAEVRRTRASKVLSKGRLSRVYTLGELFVGAGGMALGASQSEYRSHRFSHSWANDKEDDACQTLAKNFPSLRGSIKCCPVEELNFSSLPPVDGLVFGFPCNDFSIVGGRKGISGKYGGLYMWAVKALDTLRPSFFVAENVDGLTLSGGKRDFQVILSEFNRVGYDLFPKKYFFEEYGVPQARHRIIVVGFRRDLGIMHRHPSPDKLRRSCREALQGIPEGAANHERTRQAERVVERLRYIRPGENAFTADLPERLRLRMRSGATISQIYRRLHPDKPSYTVTGSGGGGTHVYHWDEPRALTNRERARLQTFPDDFVFCGGKESVRKQIGMAVPPQGARAIFNGVLQTLVKEGISLNANRTHL